MRIARWFGRVLFGLGSDEVPPLHEWWMAFSIVVLAYICVVGACLF